MTTKKNQRQEQSQSDETSENKRKVYSAPHIARYGKLKDLTTAGTGSTDDGGMLQVAKND